MIINVPIERIAANPWQTRLSKADPEYIHELAEDIAANGLLQIPIARNGSMDGDGEPIYELAFGHNRLAAYKHMYDLSVDTGKSRWATMPVDVRSLSDEQMAITAWSENEKRRDVTPIERARGIERRMSDFGWSQTQIAEQLGMSRSTVSNILRLLKLPERIQEALAKGEISERAATALLPMYELPEHVLKLAENDWYYQPRIIESDALSGASSDAIRKKVENLYERYTVKLQGAEFGLDELFPEGRVGGYDGAEGESVYCGLCRTCDRREKERGNVCLDKGCYQAKTALHRRAYLATASAACGIPAVDPNKGGNVTSIDRYQAERILATKCENLRLVYEGVTGPDDLRVVPGFKHALIVCDKRNQSCTCAQGLRLRAQKPKSQAEIEDEEREDDLDYEGVLAFDPDGDDDTLAEFDGEMEERISEPVGAQTTPSPAPLQRYSAGEGSGLSAKELEEEARRARQAKRDVPGELVKLKERLTGLAEGWLRDQEPGAWYGVVNNYLYPGNDELDMEKIRRRAAKQLVEKLFHSSYSNVDEIYRQLNVQLDRLQLPQVSKERTLVEAWGEEEEGGL